MQAQERSFALKISAIMATRMLGLFMIFPIFSIYAEQYENASPYLIGVVIGIYGLTQALLQIPFGYLSDQYGRKPLIIIGLIMFLIGSIIAADATDIKQLIIGRALQGSGAISAVLMAFLTDFVHIKHITKANALIGMQIGVAFMLALLLGPIISNYLHISGLFWVVAALAIVALFLVFSLPNAQLKAQYKLNYANIKSVLTINLLRLDFSIFVNIYY
jgi:MFS family permease